MAGTMPAARASRFTQSIARTLRVIRRERKMTQAQVAYRLRDHGVDMHRSSLSRIELGKSDIAMSELVALCAVYRVNIGYVMLSAELGVLLRPEPKYEPEVTR